MRKVDEGEKREKRKQKKIMSFLVATNVVASRPPERRPTGSTATNIGPNSLIVPVLNKSFTEQIIVVSEYQPYIVSYRGDSEGCNK